MALFDAGGARFDLNSTVSIRNAIFWRSPLKILFCSENGEVVYVYGLENYPQPLSSSWRRPRVIILKRPGSGLMAGFNS